MSLDPSVQALLDRGDLVAIMLVRFDLPGRVVGYHTGGRPHTWNGLTYRPNRFLEPVTMRGGLGPGVSELVLAFSGVPTPDAEETITRIEDYAYRNAPAIVTWLAGVPETNAVAGILYSSIYEIADVAYIKSPMDQAGARSLTIRVRLEPPGRSERNASHVVRSQEEQRFDNDAADTAFEYVSTTEAITRQWGQVRR